MMMRGLLAAVLGGLCGFGSAAMVDAETTRPNVLFIAVDDLRPLLGCYGDPIARTPNLDKLASSGVLFKRAYCQQAVCAPSRASIMTSRRPDSTKVWDLKTHFRAALPNAITLPQLFKENGYETRSIGKIYHGGLDDPRGWSAPPVEERPDFIGQRDVAETAATETTSGTATGFRPRPQQKERSWIISNENDEDLRDGQVATGAIKIMNEVKEQPFFLAVGFVRPHLPFIAPKKYYDLYPSEKIQLSDNPRPPVGVPKVAMHTYGELRSYKDIQSTGPLSEQKARELVRGYYASISYVDAQIGRVLAELERLGLTENTVVVLWGDHGYLLGDHSLWCKHANFELATRVPLIVRAPNQTKASVVTDELVELLDVYPTLSELAGLTPPVDLEGKSLAPLIRDGKPLNRKAAFSQYPREGKSVMGYTMRTDGYRYTEWRKESGEVVARELYDHAAGHGEQENIAAKPERAALVAELSEQLEAARNSR